MTACSSRPSRLPHPLTEETEMPVEIKNWQTRCDCCGHVYGEYWETEEEAEAYHAEGGGVCDDCAGHRCPPPDPR